MLVLYKRSLFAQLNPPYIVIKNKRAIVMQSAIAGFIVAVIIEMVLIYLWGYTV